MSMPNQNFHYIDESGALYDYIVVCDPPESIFWSTKKPSVAEYKVTTPGLDRATKTRVRREIFELDLADYKEMNPR